MNKNEFIKPIAMNTTRETQTDLEKRTSAKSVMSGTNADRYADYHTVHEAEQLSKPASNSCASLIPGVNANVGTLERILMVAAGGYLLYNALKNEKKNITQGIAGTTMLARGISGYCPVYNALGKDETSKSDSITIKTNVTIDKPIEEVYAFWRNLENLPKFMTHLKSVTEKNATHSHWIAKGPAGIGTISWDAKILMEDENRLLSWQSLPGASVSNAGKVVFKQIGNSTELDVLISYHAPLGDAGEMVGNLLNPLFEKMILQDIQGLKMFLEEGKLVNA